MLVEKNDDIINFLVDIYHSDEEWWHNEKMSKEDSFEYFKCMINKGRIIYLIEDGIMLGYLESWRINYEQMGKLICHAPFSSCVQDVENGFICYLSNIWIKPSERRGKVFKELKRLFFEQNNDCLYFIGHAMRKKTQPVKVFSRQGFYDKYIKKGGTNGC